MWGLKSKRGEGPWLGVDGDSGDLVLIDEPYPPDARFLWGFTTVRKRIKLISSQSRYLTAELNRTVCLFSRLKEQEHGTHSVHFSSS